jgi:hypothetical protein
MERYIAVQEPTCTWAVLDTFDDVPAEFGGVVLVGLDEERAVELASSANLQRRLKVNDALARGRLRLVAQAA